MNDRFKFRVFLKYNEIMCDIDSYCFLQGLNKCVFHFTNGGQKTLKNNDFILMQCTGLKDKNGKLIYESDILKDKYGALHPISWNIKGFYEADTFAVAGFYNAIQEDMEVIGNIYENKELLKSEG